MGGERSVAVRARSALISAGLSLLVLFACASALADAQPLGAIEGTVTLASTETPIEGDEVCLGGLLACALTDARGEYAISGIPDGEYKVAFTNRGLVCATKQYNLDYLPQWYDEKSSAAEADPVSVAGSAATKGIDASIVTAQEVSGGVNEYLCNRAPAQPISEGGGTSPGAIEPLQGNAQFEEEFWADPPWEKAEAEEHKASLAVAARSALVRHGIALLRLDCTGPEACGGTLELVSKVTARRASRPAGKRRSIDHVRVVVLGRVSFWLAAGKSSNVRVPLTRSGKSLLGKAGSRGLDVELSGSDVQNATVLLK